MAPRVTPLLAFSLLVLWTFPGKALEMITVGATVTCGQYVGLRLLQWS
jgi:hypothetical protein